MLAALLVAGVAPADLRANTTLDSGTTTLSKVDYYDVLYVGKTDAATLKVNAGGVAVIFYDGYLGNNANGFGTVTVESGGGWDMGGWLYVGFHGTGILNVTGGWVNSGGSSLGDRANGFGTATVESGGTWANSGNLIVGYAGTGTLNVTGGNVTNSGTGVGSGDLYVGYDGTGTLNVTGGSVTNKK